MKSIVDRKHLMLAAIAALAATMATQSSLGQGNDNGDDDEDEDEEELPFDEAELFFELNDTDGDLGIQGAIEGEAWKRLIIEGPDERQLLNIWVRRWLRSQGLSEFLFESDEPGFDELTPAQFFARFPEGTYEIEGLAKGGGELEAEIELSHVMAGPPDTVTVNGMPEAPNCDSEELPVVSGPVTVDWSPVEMSHPTIGTPNVAVEVAEYHFVGEIEREGTEPEELEFFVVLPPDVTQFTYPEDFTALSDGEVKYEIITKLDNGNLTAVESCFEIE
jgi:hypothetical protein